MRIGVISIGSELLIGHTVNTNLAYIGEQLAAAGFTVDREVCIPDLPPVMEETMRQELAAAELVITIGGLGPTRDDLTRDIAARVMGAELREEATVRRHIEQYLGPRLPIIPPTALQVQSRVPVGATAILNHNGTAPGLWCPCEGRTLVLLPGPPRELQPMFESEIMPRIRQLADPDRYRRSLRLYGIPEAAAAEKLESSIELPAEVEIAYCARAGEIDVRLTALPELAPRVDQIIEEIRLLFSSAALPESTDLVGAVANLLKLRRLSLALAESCTGGLIAGAITDRAGASEFFHGSIVCYSNQSKQQLLGVPGKVLEQHGAVSQETALAMATGAQRQMAADCAIAVTGIAGPGGGTVDKPVGLVYIATAVKDQVRAKAHHFNGHRERIRARAVTAALDSLRIHLDTEP